MGSEKKSISRRTFLGRTTKTGLALSTVASPVATVHGITSGKDVPHRFIDESLCTGCRLCMPLCPMSAIRLKGRKAWIDPDECCECGVCSRSGVCPEDAMRTVELEWPRVLRSIYSNPLAEHEATRVPGRGTEGIKTNDSQGTYEDGFFGVFVELGRPVLGARFRDVERVVKKFKAHGFDLVAHNPVASLVENTQTGALKPEVLQEKVISCLLEFILPERAKDEFLNIIQELAGEVDTVFNVSVALHAANDGTSSLDALVNADTFRLPNAKVNIGLAQGIVGEGV